MNTVTIPKKITRGEELVVISRREYERFFRLPGIGKKEKGLAEAAIKEGLRDLREGRVSPTFRSAKAAVRYIHRQAKKFNRPK